jgi:hypothetical protein
LAHYGVRSIWNYLLGYPPDVEFEKTLLIDRGLPPYLRLAVLSQPNYFAEPRWMLLSVARAELDTLRMGPAEQGEITGQIADCLYLRFERTARTLDELKGR